MMVYPDYFYHYFNNVIDNVAHQPHSLMVANGY
jgi:hypothetical protein